MMKMKLYLPIIFFLLFTACEVINPEEEIPTFITINNFEHEEVGTAKIVDAWFYIDNDLQGIYSLPITIPILKSGNQQLYVAPGIKENGISATRTNYPFYVWHQEEVNLLPLDTTQINPSTSYISDCIQWEESFNGSGSSFHQNLFEYGVNMISDTFLMTTGGYGEVILDGGKMRFECTTDPVFLPKNRRVYLEMDYKCNTPFLVNIYKFTPTYANPNTVMLINKQEEWNKIYIYLSEHIAPHTDANEFSLSFLMFRDSTLSQSELLIDNVKILYEE